jgi:hypothetical protein
VTEAFDAFEDRERNLFHRIEWGLRDNRVHVATLLTEYINGDNATHAEAAWEVFKQLRRRSSIQFLDCKVWALLASATYWQQMPIANYRSEGPEETGCLT